MEDGSLIFKIVIIGNSNTGKSSLLNVVSNRVFNNSYTMTIGVDFDTKVVNIRKDGRVVGIKLQIWDTAGQESFRSITRSYYREAAGIIIVYDITNESSYSALNQWIEDAQYFSRENIPIILCGNKCDLDMIRSVNLRQATDFAKEKNLPYFETSAKNTKNVNNLFEKIAELIYEKNKESIFSNKKLIGIKKMDSKLNTIKMVSQTGSSKYKCCKIS